MEGSESYHKITQEADDTYSTDYGWGLYKDDDNSSAKSSKYRRTYTWNEKNQLISSVDSNYSTAYVYGQDGQRSNKYTQNSETLYFNKMWTLHTDSGNSVYGGQTAKNIYLGETRIVTKLNGANDPTYQEEYYKQYFYHSDHLGSASLISDYNGDEYQRIEYTPYGETWVEKTSNTGMEYLPYKFTAKELDEETGLYYYGARYLDPRYSRWISTDPALSEYVEGKSNGSSGGIYNSINLNLYHYAGNNPLKYTDPDGREDNHTQIRDLTEDELEKVTNAMNKAKTNLTDLLNKLQNYLNDENENKVLGVSIKDATEKWLGITLDDNDSVQSFFNDINSVLDGLNDIDTFKYDPNDRSNAYVYTYESGRYNNDGTIYFGQGLRNFSGDDSRSGYTLDGTIFHEGTHKKLNTSDSAYSRDDCLRLPNKSNNANNWRYMYEKIYNNGS